MRAERMTNRCRLPGHVRGAGLIEVLVAVLVLGIGLLGIAGLQATALRNSQSSLERSQAAVLSYAILDAMRANRTAALDGDYEVGLTCETPAAGGTLAEDDMSRWIGALKAGLNESACGEVQRVAGTDIFTVTVRWNDQRASGSAEEDNVSVTTRTRI